MADEPFHFETVEEAFAWAFEEAGKKGIRQRVRKVGPKDMEMWEVTEYGRGPDVGNQGDGPDLHRQD